MSGSPRTVLPDTNILIAALRGDQAVRQELAKVTVVLSAIVLGELYDGAYASRQAARELTALVALMAGSTVLPCTEGTAAVYGQIRLTLRRAGTLIPDNDIWIAASALQYGVPVITRDAHFSSVPGLSVERW